MTSQDVSHLIAFPRGVTDPLCAQGHVIETSMDHRMLWYLEMQICGSAPTGSHLMEQWRALKAYLNATCQHHWHEYVAEPGDDIGSHRQCLWCNDVEWADGWNGATDA
jgi:hypothetical protein